MFSFDNLFAASVPLSRVGKIYSGGTPDSGNPDYWGGKVAWCVPSDLNKCQNRFVQRTKRCITDLGLKKSSAHLMPGGSILVCTRASVGEVAIAGVPISTNQGFKNIVPNACYDSDFLYYCIVFSKGVLMRLACGSTFLEVSKRDFEKIRIPNLPLPEQKKIAEILRACDEAIVVQERLIAQKQQRKKGLMQQLLTGTKRFPQFAGTEWRESTFRDQLEFFPRKVDKPKSSYLSIGVRSHARGTFQKPNCSPDETDIKELYVVQEDDVVLNISFAWEHAIAVAKGEDTGALVSHRFPTFTCRDYVASPKYFRHFVQMPRVKYDLKCVSPGGAGRNRVLSKKDFLKLKYTFPCFQEQNSIGGFLDAQDEEIALQQNKLDQLKQQKKGLMQQLLTGKVRVKV